MKIWRVLVIGLCLLFGLPVSATTLLLPDAIELVIVDGVTVNRTLLRSADSLELAKGRHQLLFKLNENALAGQNKTDTAKPVYVIAHFDTGDARRLQFQLPSLTTREDVEHFLSQPALLLLDEHGMAVSATYRRVPAQGAGPLSPMGKPSIVYRPATPLPMRPRGQFPMTLRLLNISRGYFSLLFV